MKLCVVALDYDGTIARDGRADPLVLEAIREAQTRGIVSDQRQRDKDQDNEMAQRLAAGVGPLDGVTITQEAPNYTR